MIGKLIKILVSYCMVALLSIVLIYAQNIDNKVIDVKIYFPYDGAQIYSTYMSNRNTLLLVDSLLNNDSYISTIQRIEITAQSSPEGSVDYNEQLSLRREESLKEYFITKYPHINQSLWSFKSVAENWELFHQHLTEDLNLPYRQEVLSISSSARDADQKEQLLRTIHGGSAWHYITKNILPTQRFGASILFIPFVYDIPAVVEKPIEAVYFKPIEEHEQIPIIEQEPEVEEVVVVEVIEEPVEDKEQKILFALKTNLVLDLLSVINIGVEVPIGKRWSVVGEVVYPWWRSWKNDFTMQIESYHGELKYWLGDRDTKEQLQGWSVGAYGGWGRYDIQPFSQKGVQGEVTDFGLEVGYAHSIARNLNLEYNIGVGYVSTKYNNYKMAYETDEYGDIKVIPYPWMNSSLKSILPTRCGVSLVWTIKNRRGER